MRSLELKVGAMIVLATAILVAFIFVLGNFSLRDGFRIAVDFDYVGSLQPGAPVKVSGIKVGKIESVELWGGKSDPALDVRVQVRVSVWIEDRVRDSIRSDAEFFINTTGMLGEQYLEIVSGRDYTTPPIANNAVIHGRAVHDPPRTDLVVARLYDVLDGVAVVLRDDRDAIKHLLSNGAAAVKTLNELLRDHRERIGALIGNGAELAHEATLALASLDRGKLAALVGETSSTLRTARESMTALTPRAEALMSDVSRVTGLVTEQRVDKAIDAIDVAASAAHQAGGLIANVDGLVTDMRAGRGTAGALLARDDVYRDLRELLRDLKRNPWKLFWKE